MRGNCSRVLLVLLNVDAGVKNYIYKNGKRIEAASVMEGGATYKTVDYNAQMQRHTQLLRRQHFMDRK